MTILAQFDIWTSGMRDAYGRGITVHLSAKSQKRDQDVLEAFAMIDDVMEPLASTRTRIDTVFELWYDEVLKLANEVGATESVPRLTTLQRSRSNTPSSSPMEH